MQYHLPLTPFTRDLPITGAWAASAVVIGCSRVRVAEQDGRLLGFALGVLRDCPADGLVRPIPPGLWGRLHSVDVTDAARRRGIGSSIVAATACALVDAGATRLSAAFVPTNPTAAPFRQHRGFAPVWDYWAVIVEGA